MASGLLQDFEVELYERFGPSATPSIEVRVLVEMLGKRLDEKPEQPKLSRCTFCQTPVDNGAHAKVLAHVLGCPRHPMRALERQLQLAGEEIARLTGEAASHVVEIQMIRAANEDLAGAMRDRIKAYESTVVAPPAEIENDDCPHCGGSAITGHERDCNPPKPVAADLSLAKIDPVAANLAELRIGVDVVFAPPAGDPIVDIGPAVLGTFPPMVGLCQFCGKEKHETASGACPDIPF